MKSLFNVKAILTFLIFSQSAVLRAQSQTESLIFVPKIQYEKATLTGKIEGVEPVGKEFKSISMSLYKVVTGEKTDYEIPVKKDGTFTFIVLVQSISIATLSSDFFDGPICLLPGEETKLEIYYDNKKNKHVEIINSLGITAEDGINIKEFFMTIGSGIGFEVLAPEIYCQRILNRMPDLLKPIENSHKFSDAAKQIVISEFKLICIYYFIFGYEEYISDAYKFVHKTDTVPKDFHPPIPDKSYYSCLKYFNLNDPSYLSTGSYPMVIQSILSNETLAIPSIGELPIDNWLIKVRGILKNDIGADTGLFYDLLVSNAYGKQLNLMKPLSNIQKANIIAYFTNKSFVDILIDENDKVIQLIAKNRCSRNYEIGKSSENIMDSIVSKYKGKVVFVDFWATWCVPCLKAMSESESVRREFENKDVVFVYIADTSSPRKAWFQKASEINGEQYYITEKEMNTLNKVYNFTAIPHYLIFDKNGVIKYNYGPFMGNDKMRKWIKELL